MKQFLPFRQIEEQNQVVVVDALHHHGLVFSHWRGAKRHEDLHDDTSLGIVLNAIKAGHPGINYPWVSNNHFDIDGFLGVWSLFEPRLALKYEMELRQAALIGDFREYDPSKEGADLGLKIACWLNQVEKGGFYQPFEAKDEAEACIPKYEYCLPRFAEMLQNPEAFTQIWEEEYNLVQRHQQIIQASGSSLEFVTDIRLQIVETPEPLHYYALFGLSREADMVLSLYQDHRYELEYKYTTWIDTQNRISFPRLSFHDLAAQLNSQEFSSLNWQGDRLMDTGPILRLGGEKLTKAERYNHPFRRLIASSSIPPTVLKANVLNYYRLRYTQILPQQYWTWQEMRRAQTN